MKTITKNEKYNIPSELGAKSYWDNEGQFQKEYDELYNELVPASGRAENLFGEVIRAVSRLSYEYLNNGNCNARETTEMEGEWIKCPHCEGEGVWENEDGEEYECSYCGGEGYYEEYDDCEYIINEFYEEFIEILYKFFKQYNVSEIGDKYLDRIESIILTNDNSSNYFSKENRQAYDAIVDITVAVILKEGVKNSPKLPEWYKN